MTLSLTPNAGIANPLGRNIPQVLRAPDKPRNAVRLLAVDVSDWINQAPSDPPTTVSVAVFPSATGALTASNPVIQGNELAVTIAGGAADTSYAVIFTASTALGRTEVFSVTVFVNSLYSPPIG